MNKICTSLEQSQKLVELGIDINTADMYWDYDFIKHECVPMAMDEHFDNISIPAWSLSTLLELMPIINDSTYTMRGTLDEGAVISHEEVTCVMCQEKTPIDAVFEMICWLKENKKI